MDVCVQSGEHNATWWQRTCGVRWHPSVGDWRIVEFFNSAGGARLGLVSIRWNGNKSTITSFPMKTPGKAFVVKVTPDTSNAKPNLSFCGVTQDNLVYFLLCPGGHCICFRVSKHFDCCSVTFKQTEGLLVMSTGSSISVKLDECTKLDEKEPPWIYKQEPDTESNLLQITSRLFVSDQ